ncbi:MAG: hypothetical protein KAQ97_05690 [Candidatus Fermentibacteraceae bacterium]|nr:hypothetical protein [Candidatus Fermentibacteraceae bacterium]
MSLVQDPYFRALLLLWTALLVLVFGGRMYTTDVIAQYEVAGSLIGQRPFLSASGEYGWIVSGVRPGNFIPHSIGYSVLLIPAAFSGAVFGSNAGKISIAVLNAGFSLILVGFLFAVARRRFGNVSIARLIAVAIGGMALVYGKMSFDVTAAAAAAMAGFYFSCRDRALIAGFCMGLAVMIRLDSLLLLPVFWSGWANMRKLLAGMAPFILIIAFANWYRFGSPILDGHNQDPAMVLEPFRGGIVGLLLSPGKGLLYFAPMCVFSLFFQKDWRLWTPFVLSLVLHGMLHDWSGGTGWGPRFLFTTLPFLLLPLARKGTGGRLFWLIAALSILICIPAFWSNASILEQGAGPDLFDEPGRQTVLWSFSSSPLFASVRNFGRGIPDMFGAVAAASLGLSAWLGVLMQSLIALLLAGAGITIIRKHSELEVLNK